MRGGGGFGGSGGGYCGSGGGYCAGVWCKWCVVVVWGGSGGGGGGGMWGCVVCDGGVLDVAVMEVVV